MSKRISAAKPKHVRIIGGRWRGTKIAVGATDRLRPTPNRVRETLFNWLQPAIAGARCIDLFAGTGALGIEALSRGAAEVVFVEQNRQLARQLQTQLQRLGDASEVIVGNADSILEGLANNHFDLIFADPPFTADYTGLLNALRAKLRSAGQLYVERPVDSGLPTIPWGYWHRQGHAASVCFGLLRCTAGETGEIT